MSLIGRLLITMFKGMVLLIGLLFLVGGGGCFVTIFISVVSQGALLTDLKGLAFIVAIAFGSGLFGWILIQAILKKSKYNTDVYINNEQDDNGE